MASLEIEIEENATVAQSCQISLLQQQQEQQTSSSDGEGTSADADADTDADADADADAREDADGDDGEKNDDPGSNSTPSPTSGTSNVKIRFKVTGGNVFHPNAKISIIPPTASTTTMTAHESAVSTIVVLKIGSNNLFEEECHVIFDLSSIMTMSENGNGDDNINISEGADTDADSPIIMTMIGSYNHFAAKSQVHILATHRMGNANIFNPKCKVSTLKDMDEVGYGHGHGHGDVNLKGFSHIKNGNIIQSSCCIKMKINDNDMNMGLQEKVCYHLVQPHAHTVDPTIKVAMRGHRNGVKKNIQEVSQLLGISRKIVQKHHKLFS